MANTERHRASSDARRQVSALPVSAGHAEQLNRYLSATFHHEVTRKDQQRQQVPEPAPTPATPAAKPIVVGFDDSEASREAVRWAVAEADLRGCGVRVVIVDQAAPQARPDWIGSALPGDLAEWYRTYVASPARGELAEERLPGVEVRRRAGRAPDVLVELSEDAQLLVLGTRGRGQMLDAVLGSVSRHCARHAHCPVVVIPSRRRADQHRVAKSPR